ncbi:MAG TPA: hypothetical protein VK849_15525 [Longimicrobiales bacterium]|nr:hypothetical protein [Longimicrobiales bacterium]
MRRRWILFAVILTAPTGCDNVAWGGVDVRLEGPTSPPAVYASEPEDTVEAIVLPELPTEPILLAGTRTGDTARMTVVGPVQGAALGAFPSDDELPNFRDHFANTLLAPGTELVLFSEGVRVGRMTVASTVIDETLCVPHPVAVGVAELLPGASQVERLMALRDTSADDRPFGDYAPPGGLDQRAVTLALGANAIEESGAPWPPSLTGARADFQAFRRPEGPGAEVATTFLFADELGALEPQAPNAYALFVLGAQEAGRWRPQYVWYRRADGRGGKGAPRYFGTLDWDGDGSSEILLEVFGTSRRWFAALGQRDSVWVETFQDPCGQTTG